MTQANPTYLIEHLGSTTRITVTHVFTDEERLQFTAILPSGPDTMNNLHERAFGRIRQLLALLP